MLRWILVATLLFSGYLLASQRFGFEWVIPVQNDFRALRVAHAGGGINGDTYTNSYEALDLNYRKGFRYFELDFNFTSDHHLVCIHDWEVSFEANFGFSIEGAPTLNEFERYLETRGRYRNCTLQGLSEWMRENEDAILVTDVKDDNLAGLRAIRKSIPDAGRRVIPQVRQPGNFSAAREMGYASVIWTLYQFSGSEDEILDLAGQLEPPLAITMPVFFGESTLPKRLARRNIPSYVHTINSSGKTRELQDGWNVTEIYTDFLPPSDS